MKNITITLVLIAFVILINAQPPQPFKYQAVARDGTGKTLPDQNK